MSILPWHLILKLVAINTITIFGIVTNAICLYIFTRPSFATRSINILLAALSSADLCVCLLGLPTFDIRLFLCVPGVLSDGLFEAMHFSFPFLVMAQTFSSWILIAITIDRFMAVCYPFHVMRYCTRSRAIATVIVTATLSIAHNLLYFWDERLDSIRTANKSTVIVERNPCDGKTSLNNDSTSLQIHHKIALVLEFLLPFLVHSILNMAVARTIMRAGKKRQSLCTREKKEQNTARMVICVVLIFLFCNVISFVYTVSLVLNDKMPFLSHFKDVSNILIMVNSSSTFLVYSRFSSRFRNQLRLLFTCGVMQSGSSVRSGKRTVFVIPS